MYLDTFFISLYTLKRNSDTEASSLYTANWFVTESRRCAHRRGIFRTKQLGAVLSLCDTNVSIIAVSPSVILFSRYSIGFLLQHTFVRRCKLGFYGLADVYTAKQA